MKFFKFRPNIKEILLYHLSSWPAYYAVAVQAAYAYIPDYQRVHLPSWTESFVANSTLVAAALVVVFKCVDQVNLPSKAASAESEAKP